MLMVVTRTSHSLSIYINLHIRTMQKKVKKTNLENLLGQKNLFQNYAFGLTLPNTFNLERKIFPVILIN